MIDSVGKVNRDTFTGRNLGTLFCASITGEQVSDGEYRMRFTFQSGSKATLTIGGKEIPIYREGPDWSSILPAQRKVTVKPMAMPRAIA